MISEEAIRGLVTIAAIVVGTTGLMALSVGWRALLLLPLFALAFVLPAGTVTLLARVFVVALTALVLLLCLSAHLRHRLTVPEFGRPSRRSRDVSVFLLALGTGTVVACGTVIWEV